MKITAAQARAAAGECMLTRYSVNGFWEAVMRDDDLARETEERHGMSEGSVKTKRSLYPEKTCGEENAYVLWKKARGDLRAYYYLKTFPWESPKRGVKAPLLLETPEYPEGEFVHEMNRLTEECYGAYQGWCLLSSYLKDKAREGLGDKFDDEEFPAVDLTSRVMTWTYTTGKNGSTKTRVKSMVFEIVGPNLEPIPRSDHLITALTGPMLEQTRRELDERLVTSVRQSMQTTGNDLVVRMADIARRLADPKAKNIEAMILEMRDYCASIPRALNLTDDPDLNAAAATAAQALAGIDVESIRGNEDERRRVAGRMAQAADEYGDLARSF